MSPSPVQALFQQAMGLHRAGRLAEAEQAYRQIMRVDARDYPSRCMLGRLYLDLGRNAEAEKVLEAAVKLDGRAPPGLSGYGLALLRVGKFKPAAAILERAIAAEPNDWSLRCNLGDALLGLGRPQDAVAAYDHALGLAPDAAPAWARRATALLDLERPDAALADAERALGWAPRDAQALAARAAALTALDRVDEAIVAVGQAMAAAPDDHGLAVDRARLLFKAGRFAEAASDCTRALTQDSQNVEALIVRGAALAKLHQPQAALADAEAATALTPRDAEAQFIRGLRLDALGRGEAAIEAYKRALALGDRKRPDLRALNNLGASLIELKRYGEAIAALRQVLAVEPRHRHALGAYAHAQRMTCDWTDAAAVEAALRTIVETGEAEVPPGVVLAYFDDPDLQLKAARNHAAANMVAVAPRPAPHARGERLRIAYLSADFHDHATMRLAIGVFERHDRARFDVCAISFGPDDGSALRARTVAAFETFLDAQAMSDEAIVAWMRERRIDVAVDLKGFTAGSRKRVFAARPAAVQVNYLGFPGTLGSEAYDYVLADAITAPSAMWPFFSEKIVHLPDSYQPNDSHRETPIGGPSRADAGLPPAGFVFCCFNNSYKITPSVFGVWMRLLAAVEGSVIWLLGDNELAMANLRKEAAVRGVDPARLVFAPRVTLNDHLARHRLADLCLDTLPYGAHTTASDALWMGLPIVTCLGAAFAGRVGASLCAAAGLDALIAPDLTAYEALALSLARDPERLDTIKAHLAAARTTAPLFDDERYRRGLEAAYEVMWTRREADEPPAAFAVGSVDDRRDRG
ncbi:tetratricopeptide repeat protein [Phenylobacterium immobile]|uniref:tetratricopeptide repeat protein n=1 Tax=Phenylobacterium immobile TaxID=21 RepID=UPI000A977CBC|nr:tetratricopeptide repeat protein [Phenylobacterium immobile]